MGMTIEEQIMKLQTYKMYEGEDTVYVKRNDVLKALEQQPKTGHWIEVTNGRGGHECDVCHDYAPSFQNGNEYLSAFCPNCGADMRGDTE